MPQPVLIFANPIAGKGKGRHIAGEIARRLARDGYKPMVILQPPAQTPDSAIPPDARCAIVVGGDGTVRAVARRLMSPPASSPDRGLSSMPPLLVVPMGTANLLGRHLGTRWDASDRLDNVSVAFASMQTRELDAASANGELFLLMAGIGLDARIVHELDRIRHGPIAYASYLVPAVLALGRYDYPPLTVTVDGQTIARDLPSVAFVGNVKEYGTGFSLLPLARPDDGLLDVCVLPCAGRRDAIRQFLRAAVGTHVSAEGTVYVRGRKIRIESPARVPVQVDGEATGHTPVDIELLPSRVRFIVPPAGLRQDRR